MVAWWLPMMMGGMMGGGQKEGEGLQPGQSSIDFTDIQEKNIAFMDTLNEKMSPTLEKFDDLGKTMGSKRTLKAVKNTKGMFMAMRRAATSAGIMQSFMNVFKSFLIMLEPFIPIFELIAGIIEAFLTPAMLELIKALTPLYQALAAATPAAMNLNFSLESLMASMNTTGSGAHMLDIILVKFGTSLGDVFILIAEATNSGTTFTKMLKIMGWSLDGLSKKFELLIAIMKKIIIPGGGGGGDGGDGGDGRDPWGPLPIPWIGFANEGIAMKPTFGMLGEKEPEAVLKISRLEKLIGRADPELLYYQQQNLLISQEILIELQRNRRERR